MTASPLFETALTAFATLFAVVGPVDVAVIFAAITPRNTPGQRRAMAVKGTIIALVILLVFALTGGALLDVLGISLPALRTAGGILLLLMAIDMVFARPSGGISTTAEETAEGTRKEDVSVFPLATPLIAGPGAMGATILLASHTEGDARRFAAVIGALLAVLALTFVLLLTATRVQRLIGVTGQHVITRVAGVLLAALAVQFVFDGVRNSGLLGAL